MIDWERILELRDEVGAEDFGEVVELFLEEVEGVLDRLRVSPDLSSLEEDFHFLKGSALNLGFAAFGSLCLAAEKASAEGRAVTVDIPQALECYAASKLVFLRRAANMGIAA